MRDEAEGDKRFHGDPGRLRSAERLARLEPDRVVAFTLEGGPIETLLDVGTGTGLFAGTFSASGISVTGVDVNRDLLELARKEVPGGRFVEAAAEALPFEDCSFDMVFMACLLHESYDQMQVLKEAARTARGRIVVVEWPYRVETQGPPIEHRLAPGRIVSLARSAGLIEEARCHLSHVDIYRFSILRAGSRDAAQPTEK
jgi:SAM-dependent methyltransferase